ncbi:tetratricopeptide repeat protein [Desulfosarcina sp. OttesenSCG-928-G10]|nr:tetratricopeptide repeat protein [Desulfosarcina sp. OttesenSCG-928-G10]
MKQPCRYHPAAIAQWYCEKCESLLCPRCVDIRSGGGYRQDEKFYMCPNCNLPLQWVGIVNIIDPFWKRMSRFFVYPFAKAPLLLMLILAGCVGVASLSSSPDQRTLLLRLVSLLSAGISLKYAYSILKATASGDLVQPELSTRTLVDDFGPVLKQMGIYIAIGLIIVAIIMTIGPIGIIIAIIFFFATIPFIPAMFIILILTESLFQAINPVMFIGLAVRIGWGYVSMTFLFVTLMSAPGLLDYYAFHHFPYSLRIFLMTAGQIYYTFVTYHLMGYVILQYHEDIGYDVDFTDFRDGTTEAQTAAVVAADPETQLLRRVQQMVKDGSIEEARTLVEKETARTGIANPILSENYYTLLKMTGEKDKQVAHAARHIENVVQKGDGDAAVEIYQDCVAHDPAFTPSAGSLMKIGGWLNEKGKRKEAIQAFNRLTKAYAEDPLVPKAYFLAAQIFNEHLKDPERARKILTSLIQRYPAHDIAPFLERYLERIP